MYAGKTFGHTTRLRSTVEKRAVSSAANRRACGVHVAWTYAKVLNRPLALSASAAASGIRCCRPCGMTIHGSPDTMTSTGCGTIVASSSAQPWTTSTAAPTEPAAAVTHR